MSDELLLQALGYGPAPTPAQSPPAAAAAQQTLVAPPVGLTAATTTPLAPSGADFATKAEVEELRQQLLHLQADRDDLAAWAAEVVERLEALESRPSSATPPAAPAAPPAKKQPWRK